MPDVKGSSAGRNARARNLVSLAAASLLFATGCFAGGGLFTKGGRTEGVGVLPSATMTHGVPYRILCRDKKAWEKREKEMENGESAGAPPVHAVEGTDYRGGCEEVGESSQFYLFGLFAVTPPLSPEYAIAMAVQRLEGDTMVHIRMWQEIHYYALLGRVSVLKVKGDVVKFENPGTPPPAKRGDR